MESIIGVKYWSSLLGSIIGVNYRVRSYWGSTVGGQLLGLELLGSVTEVSYWGQILGSTSWGYYWSQLLALIMGVNYWGRSYWGQLLGAESLGSELLGSKS